MLVIYSFIIILTFSIFGYIILNNYQIKAIKNQETRLFQTANIVADTYKGNLDDIIFSRIMVKSYANQANARILVIDSEGQVLVDNYNTYTDKTLNNIEVRNGLTGRSTSNIYNIDQKDILQLSVPIRMNISGKTEIIGVVLVSSSLEAVTKDTLDLRNDIIKVASLSLLGALILTAISATSITKSLRFLTYGVEELSSGHLGYQVENSSGGDIGKLISTFNEMSEKLSNIEKTRKSFINSVSHELKTPLTSINALIDSLSIGENSIDTYKEYMDDIKEETERMESLVNYLMGSIKLEDINLDIQMVDMGDLIEESIKLITPYAEKNDVEIKSRLLKDINIKCDRNKIKEVLLNLIENAIKYKDDKKSNKYVIVNLSKTNNSIVINIEDNGLGISEENLASIFERGFRVLDTKKIEGYGIGLSIVKNIIDKHNWRIDINSSENMGSIFTIEVPTI